MSNASLPGFTAEHSLRPSTTGYRATSFYSLQPAGRAVAPQLPPAGCGECTSQRCACGGGGIGVFGGGSALGFLL